MPSIMKFLSKYLFVVLLFCAGNSYSAIEIIGVPDKVYQLIGGGGNYSSYDEIVTDINTAREQDYLQCLSAASPPYSCTKYTITGIEAGLPYRITNDELQFVLFPRDSLNTSQATSSSPVEEVYRTNIGSLGGYFSLLTCDSGHLVGNIVGENEYKYDCVEYVDYFLKMRTKQGDHCTTEGNPCNPATGNKFEIASDYTSNKPHGLSFNRYYNSLEKSAEKGGTGNGWTHSFGETLNLKHEYQAELSSSIFATKEKACSDGWEELKYEYMGNDSERFFARIKGFACEIYSDEGVFDYGEILSQVRGSDVPTATSSIYKSIVRSDGSLYFFRDIGDDGYDSSIEGMYLSDSADGYAFTEKNGEKETYDVEGKLVSTESVGGSVRILQYDLPTAEGGDDNPETLDRISNHLGESLTLTHDENGNLSTLTTPDGDIQYTYVSDLLDTVTYPDGKTRSYHYEDPNFPTHLTGITDENGDRYVTWVYNSDGKVEESSHAGGKDKVTFSYQSDKTVVNEFLDDGTSAQRTYTFELVKGMLKTKEITGDQCLTCNNGHMKTREYDANGFLSGYTDWNGNQTTMVNNQYGYPETITKAVGTPEQRVTSIQYHTQWRSLPVLITEPERKTDLSYDAAGRLESRIVTDLTTGETRTMSRTYDSNGLLDKVDGARTDVSDITDYDYDARGNLLQVTNALGHVAKILEHDPSGRPKQIQDANSQITLIDYYPRGWIKSINYTGSTTQFEYDGVGQLTKTILPNNVTLVHEYDAAHRLVKTLDGAGNSIVYEYDVMGNIRSQKVNDASGALRNNLERTYYNNGWLKEVIGATNQQTTTLVRDAMGNVTNHENPRDNSSDQVFDALNRLKQVVDAAEGITKYEYDGLGNINTVIAPNGARTVIKRNGFGELYAKTSPDTGGTLYTHNEAGQVKTETDARGITVTNEYDALNRVTSMIASDGQSMGYHYDEGVNGIGRLSRVVDNSGETRYEYDVRGNRTAEIRIQDGITTRMGYAYDIADQLETITYPSGHQIKYGRNALNQVDAVRVIKDGVEQPLLQNGKYLPFGPLESFTWGNGQDYVATYDQDYRLTAQATTGWAARTYHHDDADNIDLIGVDGQTRAFAYDKLERLQQDQTVAGPVIIYQYDANGNRELSDLSGSLLDDYSYVPGSNLLQSITGQQNETPIHDEVGNLKQDSRFAYTYDAFGRLTHVVGEGQSIEYAYNARHQRVRKTVDGVNTYFQYDNSGRLLVEQDAEGRPSSEYIYLGLQPIGLLVAATSESVTTFTLVTSGAELDAVTVNVILGDNPALIFATNDGVEHEVSGSDVEVIVQGDTTLVNTNYIVGNSHLVLKLVLKPLDPASSSGNVLYTEKTFYNAEFANATFNADKDRFKLTNVDGEQLVIKVKPDKQKVILKYPDGRRRVIKPNTQFIYKPGKSRLRFKHVKDGLKINGQIGRVNRSDKVVVEENVSVVKNLFLEGESGSGGNGSDVALYQLHTDQLATIHTVTDKDQTIVWRGEHDAFGQTYATIDELDNPLRFPGQYYDEETGLHYNWHRYYNPATGRYISSDPIGLAGGLNTFGYVGQSPLVRIDLTGEAWFLLPALATGTTATGGASTVGGIGFWGAGGLVAGGLVVTSIPGDTSAPRTRSVQDSIASLLPQKDPNGDECKKIAQKIANTIDEIYNKRYPGLMSNLGNLPIRIGPGEMLRETVRGHEKLLNRRLNELRKLEDKYDRQCRPKICN